MFLHPGLTPFLLLLTFTASSYAQEVSPTSVIAEVTPAAASPDPAVIALAAPDAPPGGKRLFGVLPNYRTADASQEGTVIPARRKLYIARKDSFDYPLLFISGIFAGIGQATGQQPSFGQGTKGFAHRLATNYVDQAVGNLLAEGVFPALLHQDPRYFVRGSGPVGSRIRYAVSRVIITRQDGHGSTFNYSEWLGNASAVAFSNVYYPDGRTFGDNSKKLLWQVGTDAMSQLLKEFWPDLRRKFLHK